MLTFGIFSAPALRGSDNPAVYWFEGESIPPMATCTPGRPDFTIEVPEGWALAVRGPYAWLTDGREKLDAWGALMSALAGGRGFRVVEWPRPAGAGEGVLHA